MKEVLKGVALATFVLFVVGAIAFCIWASWTGPSFAEKANEACVGRGGIDKLVDVHGDPKRGIVICRDHTAYQRKAGR